MKTIKFNLPILILFLFTNLSVFSQSLKIEGKVVEQNLKAPIEGTGISLFSADSATVASTIADKSGHFKLTNLVSGNYILKASHVGYNDLTVELKDFSQSIRLDNLVMETKNHELNEVVVEANEKIITVDRMIVFPSPSEKKISSTTLDLLSNMMLPNLKIDPVNRTMATNDGKEVEIRIDGVKVTQDEIEALKSSDIIRVEYQENPGIRYGMNNNTGAVINCIIYRPENGFAASFNLRNAPFTGFGNDVLSLKFNRKKSEFSLNYNLSYRDYTKRYIDRQESYYFPDEFIERTIEGIPSPFGYQTHNINLGYNLTEPDKYVFNVIIRNRFQNRYARTASSIKSSDMINSVNSLNNTTSSSYLPSLDLYYMRQLRKNESLELNLVTSYLKTSYNRYYFEKDGQDTLSNFQSVVDGKQYSLLGEIAYSKKISKINFAAGLNQMNIWEQNDYINNSGIVKNSSSITYLYAQIMGKIRKFSYQLGLAEIMTYTTYDKISDDFYAFRPRLSVMYSLTKSSNLQFQSSISSNGISLSNYNNVTQHIDNYTALRGNATIKPYRSYFNSISYDYQKKIFYGRIRFGQAFHEKPVMEYNYYDGDWDKFIKTEQNQKNLQLYTTTLDLRLKSLFNNRVTIGITGQYLHYESNGLNYNHSFDNFSVKAQMNVLYRNLSLLVQGGTRAKFLWGETVTYDENSSSIQLQYNKNNLIIGLGILYPLSNAWKAGEESLSELIPYQSWTTIKDNGHMLYINLSWNFTAGRKYKSGQKNLSNESPDNNILTVPE